MRKEFISRLLKWSNPYIQGTDLHHLLKGGASSRYSVIKRALKEGILVSIRRDLYLIQDHHKLPELDKFELATIIYGPSYVSFESALSYHGWIPEMVSSITSATAKRRKRFETSLGIFTYERIPVAIFSLGINQIEEKGAVQWIADPWKALADMIYTRRKSWKSIKDLYEDLRIEPEILLNSDKKMLVELMQSYPSARVQKILRVFGKELFL